MEVNVTVEKKPDARECSCFVEEDLDGCALAGYGKTVDEAVADMLAAREELIGLGYDIPELEMHFRYDLWAFFDKFPVNASAFARLVGLNASLMRQYVSGTRKPGKRRTMEIEQALHAMGNSLASVSLVTE